MIRSLGNSQNPMAFLAQEGKRRGLAYLDMATLIVKLVDNQREVISF